MTRSVWWACRNNRASGIFPIRARARADGEAGKARVVCDYIAGMTDRFAIEEHRKLFQLDVWN